MFNDIIQLVSIDYEADEAGDKIEKENKREVFATILSIGMNEFYQAQAHGYKPELAFLLPDYRDYQNETVVIYDNTRYNILRTFQKEDNAELKIIVTRETNKGGSS